jgi:DNA-binding CsgD family transcriptional regulator
MKRLSNLEYRRLLECIGELYEENDLLRLKQRLPAIVDRLVRTDLTMFGELNLSQPEKVVYRSHPNDAQPDFTPDRVARVYQEHPVLQHVKRTGYVGALKLSDFISQRQFHEMGMYQEWLREQEAEYNMNFQVTEPELPFVTSVCLMRRLRDFSEMDRLKLDLIQPHIARAYTHAVRMAAWRELAAAESEALAATRQAVVIVAAGGSVTLCTDIARHHLDYYFNDDSGEDHSLPSKLRCWMREQELPGGGNGHLPRPRQPFVTERDGARLTVYFYSGATTGQRLLLLEESRLILSAEPLQRLLGLTARRAEVLLWMTQGKTSGEIAIILGLSVSTVHKHTERIFEKLGVETRTAAALQATEILNRNAY